MTIVVVIWVAIATNVIIVYSSGDDEANGSDGITEVYHGPSLSLSFSSQIISAAIFRDGRFF